VEISDKGTRWQIGESELVSSLANRCRMLWVFNDLKTDVYLEAEIQHRVPVRRKKRKEVN
jgi:hypothetical protein